MRKILLLLIGLVAALNTSEAGGLLAGTQFSPKDVTGLKMWFSAYSFAGRADASPVTVWPDLSGNGYDATQDTSTSKPNYVQAGLNSLPSLSFDGGDYLLIDKTALNGASYVYGFLVLTWPASPWATNHDILCFTVGTSNGSRFNMRVLGSTGTIALSGRRLDADSLASVPDSSCSGLPAKVFSGVYTPATTTATLYTNSLSIGSSPGTFSTTGAISATDSQYASIGVGGSYSSSFFTGNLSEVLVYAPTAAMTDQNWLAIINHLSKKYNIQ